MNEIAANPAMLSSGSFITSTPFHQQHDSGCNENTPQSRNLSQNSAAENLEFNNFPFRKNLLGERRNNCENIPDHKLLLESSSTFSRRDDSSNKETPTSRICAGSDKPAEVATPRQPRQLFLTSLKQLHENESGSCEIAESLRIRKFESYGNFISQTIENLHRKKENPKEESLANFKHPLYVSGAKNYADLSISEMLHLYHIYRFQRRGLKPSAADIDFSEKHLLMNGMNEESERYSLSWKNRLECISAGFEKQPKIDFLSELQKMNLHSIIHYILSYLFGQDLQSASRVSQMWQKLIFEDEVANATRLCYLRKMEKFRKEREKKKLVNPFQRPPNLRILESFENVQQKEQLQLKKTIKEINFDAFIEVGKSGDKHKPKKCPSCSYLSVQDKPAITKCICLFCGYEFCYSCLKPYSNWHFCASPYLPVMKAPVNRKRYLRRL